MGQKIDPRGFRLAVTKDWSSRWYANSKSFAAVLLEDIKIREFLTKNYGRKASIGRVVIERPAKSIKVTIYTARPGMIIGKKGEGIEQIKVALQKLTEAPLHVNVEEIRKPELNAKIVADQVAIQLEKRIAFRRAMKRAMQTSVKLGAQGIKVMTSGRLNGIEIARSEWYREGRVPLHTLRANVEYSTSEAFTTYGVIGIKVWIYKGDNNIAKATKDVPFEDKDTKRDKRDARNSGRLGDKLGVSKPKKREEATTGNSEEAAPAKKVVRKVAKPVATGSSSAASKATQTNATALKSKGNKKETSADVNSSIANETNEVETKKVEA